MPATTDPLALDISDVLRLLHIADQSLRAHDLLYVQARLPLTDVLGQFDVPDLVANYDIATLTRPAACIAAFVARCQRAGVWEWCQQVMSLAELNAISIANAAAARSSHQCGNWCHDVPVATICLYPDAYRLVPLTDLPYGHSLGQCGFRPGSGTTEYIATETRLQRVARRSLKDRVLRTKHPIPPQQVWADIQARVEDSRLSACAFHEPSVDWALINDAALDILGRTPHTTTNGVNRWDRWTANDHIYEAVKSYTWDGSQPEHLDRSRVVLRSLFVDPITWEPGYEQVSNGQHRICTLRRAGATHAFIVDAALHTHLARHWDATQPTTPNR